jgi:uncharacterized protein DUF3455
MTTHVLRVIGAVVLVFGLEASAARAQPPFEISVPPVPANLEVPDGHSMFFSARAIGTQNYVCLPAATGVAWRFFAPEATLYQMFKGQLRQQVATHFLSANPDEAGLPRPTWQHSDDTSRVWGRLVESSSDPAFVQPGAIPWFLLAAAGTEEGPTGGAKLTPTAYIQRLNTSGGTAPQIGCSVAADIGRIALVPYTADYFFYRADRHKD